VAIAGLVVGVALVLAYQVVYPPTSSKPIASTCPPRSLCLDVNVIQVNGQGQIQLLPDLNVYAKAPIVWTVQTPGYSFADASGINFDDPGGNPPKNKAPAGEVTCELLSASQVKCTDLARNRGTYGYKVTLMSDPSVPPAPPLDPFIINH
jgi:hypothetical protein